MSGPTTEAGKAFYEFTRELVRGTYALDDLLYIRPRLEAIEAEAAKPWREALVELMGCLTENLIFEDANADFDRRVERTKAYIHDLTHPEKEPA